jgi:outer membrane protein assembly factor BamA
VLVFHVTEYAARLPYVTFGGLSNNAWFQVGGVDTNWLGRGYNLGAYYRYDDRHSFGLHQSMPYLLGGRWGLSYSLDRLATREPAFFNDATVLYDVTRLSGIGLVRYELLKTPGAGLTSFVEVGGGLLHEVYQKSAPASSPGPADETFWKYVLKAHFTQRNLDHHRHEREGFENVTKLQTVKTGDGRFNFWKVLNIFRGYMRPYAGANWAVRLRTGLSTNERSPFIPFVLDNYVNVRGVGNTVARGTAELTANLEHRQTLADSDHLILQGVAFGDISGWRPGGASLSDLFVADNIVSFGGLGLRLHLRYRYNITFRADYGVNLFDPAQRGPVIGIGQYF